jgi:tellurite resistance protein
VSKLNSITYFQDNEALLTSLLDELVEALQPKPGDVPALTFATLVASFERDPSKAATTAALAIMRLAEATRAAEEVPPCAS